MKLDELKKLIKEEIALILEYEVYVDDKGYAHDDEGNKWFVGEDYAGGTYGLHDLPSPGADGSSEVSYDDDPERDPEAIRRRRGAPERRRPRFDRGVDW